MRSENWDYTFAKVKELQFEKGQPWKKELRGTGKTINKLAISHNGPALPVPGVT